MEGRKTNIYTSSEFLNAASNAIRTIWWVNYYAKEFWKIIGIGDEPQCKSVNPPIN